MCHNSRVHRRVGVRNSHITTPQPYAALCHPSTMNTPPLHYPSTSSHRPYAFPIPSLYTRLPTPCRSYTDLIRSLYNALQALYSPYTVRISSHADPILSLYISYYALTEPMQTLYKQSLYRPSAGIYCPSASSHKIEVGNFNVDYN